MRPNASHQQEVRGLDDDYMLNTAADGGCVFLMGDQRCSVHAELGPEAKPEGCRRFPLGLVGTPSGGRITTEHRCPCRTMGDRPDIDPDATEPSIMDGGLRRPPHQARAANVQKAPQVRRVGGA